MKIGKDAGVAFGVLTGTTMASGLAFLFGLEPVSVIWTVSIGGIAGAAAGLAGAVLLERVGFLRRTKS
ncbi:hypothetical protein MUG84_01065 [Paenibacillus sp. KQZ6P-2]|uniref:Uncharacterized protein n=1 Tax=Paenibacillus mangrovi TaxID=2931978 RepID=A0A9X1WKS5_9BACL|nr:hypothetical protein [Paenibacillus mangrovi]MCJ8010331.1 hypothetical protein [Paenibacillus mangrovi]